MQFQLVYEENFEKIKRKRSMHSTTVKRVAYKKI